MLELIKAVNEWMWSLGLLIILCGTGIYFTIRLKFIQVRKFGEGLRLVFGHFRMNGEKREHGEMTPFQSLATAIAAQVGTGNLTGAATALVSGGPGAIFWMWVSAFFGMATIYGEAVLAQEYKTTVDGEVTGGPVYYIRQAFKGTFGKILADDPEALPDAGMRGGSSEAGCHAAEPGRCAGAPFGDLGNEGKICGAAFDYHVHGRHRAGEPAGGRNFRIGADLWISRRCVRAGTDRRRGAESCPGTLS